MSNVRNARIAYAFIIPALTIFAVLWASNAAAQRGSTLIRLAKPIGRIGESVATAVATEFVMRQAFPKDPDTSTPAGTAAATTPTTPAPGPASSSPPSPAPVYPSPPRASTQPVGYLYILTWTDADGGSYLGNLYMYGPTGTLVTQSPIGIVEQSITAGTLDGVVVLQGDNPSMNGVRVLPPRYFRDAFRIVPAGSGWTIDLTCDDRQQCAAVQLQEVRAVY